MTILHDILVHVQGHPDTTNLHLAQMPDRNHGAHVLQLSDSKQTTPAQVVGSGNFASAGRNHRRIVFKEVGTPLHDLTNHKELLGGLADALRGKSQLCTYLTSALILCLQPSRCSTMPATSIEMSQQGIFYSVKQTTGRKSAKSPTSNTRVFILRKKRIIF